MGIGNLYFPKILLARVCVFLELNGISYCSAFLFSTYK